MTDSHDPEHRTGHAGSDGFSCAGPSLVDRKRREIVYLRGLLLIALGAILIESGTVSVGSAGLTLLVLHGASNLLLRVAPVRLIRFLRFELTVGAADLACVAAALYLSGAARSALPVSCLMLTLVVALGTTRAHAAAGATAVAALHAWMILSSPAEPAHQLAPQLLFLAAIGLYLGYLARGIHRFRKQEDAELLERKELMTLVEILGAITSSIDLRQVTRTIVEKTARVVPAARCSMVFVNEARDRCYVIASHDDPTIDMLELDLGKYPEVRRAIETGKPVLIDDVGNDPLMREVQAAIAALDLQALMIVPLVFGGDVLGTLCMRASRTRHEFSPREFRFCTAVARASANAMKNALLHRQAREDAARHRGVSEKLARILDHSPAIILTTDRACRLISLNAEAERILKVSKEALMGEPFEVLVGDDAGRRLIERVAASEEVANHLCRLRDRDGRLIDVELNVSVLTDEAGEATGCVWLGRDVTALKATRTQLLQAKKLSTIGEVISGVAHELNNPLSGVLGFSELLLLRGDGEVPQEMELIHDSAVRCQKIVQNLLSFARENKPQRRHESVNAIVEKTLEMKKYQLHVNSIEIDCRLDLALPRALVDFQQLQQVFLNVINNAQQAMTEARGSKPSKLRVRSSRADGAILVEFGDNGPGMDQETLERIFDPFFTTKDPGKGTGLGLSVSYGIVNEHGGRIWARSGPGEGSTFLIELPVREAEEHVAAGGPAESLVSESSIRPGSRILVVDDEPVVLQLFVNLFEGRGYRVDTAVNGKEACESIGFRSYDLVITDVRMPEMNGIEFYGKLLKRRPEMDGRVIFITGDVVDPDTARFLANSSARTLAKPIQITEVVRTVDEMLAHPTVGSPV